MEEDFTGCTFFMRKCIVQKMFKSYIRKCFVTSDTLYTGKI